MTYPTNFEQKIGFDQIRTMLKTSCTFALGHEHVDKMQFSTDHEIILRHISITNEMLSIEQDDSLVFPQGYYHDLREMIAHIRVEGISLDEQELFDIRRTLYSFRLLADFLTSLDEERFPQLRSLASQQPISFAKTILAIIDQILDKFGHIRDNASPELARIRREMVASQGSVSRALNAILRQAQADGLIDKDVAPTLREGRLVLPVSPMYKRKIGGIVHDESATGKTVYIEPTAVIEANNKIRELESEERREKMRILQQATAEIRPFIADITNSQHFLGEIDFIHAKALFALRINAIAPRIKQQPIIDWHKAIHPLLFLRCQDEGKPIVPLNIRLESKNRILLISGPNAGGKSVCLKTVALLQYMLQCGMLVPLHESSEMGLFSKILIDIGDEQSIENDLSTYSSHLLNMKYFVRHSDNDTLLLIDEFGTGTEPQIGGAIAQATLELLVKSGALGVITTHYQNLKLYAQETEGIVNGAMLYDRQQLQPLFELSIGRPGSSFAIEIARKIGLPESIVRQAQDIVGSDYVNYDKQLQAIARDRRYWEQKRQTIHDQEKRLQEREAFYEKEIANLKNTRREMLDKAKDEAATLLQQTNATIEKTIREIKETKADKEQTRKARSRIDQLKEKIENKPKKKATQPTRTEPLTVGCDVRILDRNLTGQVLELGDKKALIAIGDIKTYIPLNQLERITKTAVAKAQKITIRQLNTSATQIHERTLQFKSQLDVRGMRGDEAIEAVMYFLDDATMIGVHQVRILHGTGNGILRQLIREYLSTRPQVESFRDEHVDFGGAGITIVELY